MFVRPLTNVLVNGTRLGCESTRGTSRSVVSNAVFVRGSRRYHKVACAEPTVRTAHRRGQSVFEPVLSFLPSMLTIRADQMAVLRRARLEALLERARTFVSDQLRRPVSRDEIDVFYERGKLYDLKSEQDFVRYMFVAMVIGVSAREPDPDWMRAILEVPTPVNELKLKRLFDAAQQHLPSN